MHNPELTLPKECIGGSPHPHGLHGIEVTPSRAMVWVGPAKFQEVVRGGWGLFTVQKTLEFFLGVWNLTAIPQESYDKSHGLYGASRGVMKPKVESWQFRSKKGLNLVIKTIKKKKKKYLFFFFKVTLIAKKIHLKKILICLKVWRQLNFKLWFLCFNAWEIRFMDCGTLVLKHMTFNLGSKHFMEK
jgi:hypothetical protein